MKYNSISKFEDFDVYDRTTTGTTLRRQQCCLLWVIAKYFRK